jgi:hypothetical protein
MVELLDQPEVCVHCGKKFRMAKSLFSHICELKRRTMQRDEKRVQMGFYAFNKFFQITQNLKKNKTYEDFCKSPYYNAFVKFGSFINNTAALYPEEFIEYVIKNGIKLDHWCKEDLYFRYMREIIKTEPVESAIQRSLMTMMDWADANNAEYNNYFVQVSLNRAVHDIVNGKISAWVILNTAAGKKMVNRFNDEQLTLILPSFDIPYWSSRFKERPDDVTLVKEICQEADIK